jgi:predicted nucleotidyltransferase
MKKTDLALPIDQFNQFCQQWQIIELSLFGSILRDDFHADSDIDILVAFAPTANSSRLKLASVKSSLMPKSFLIDRRVKIVICIESHLPNLV